MKKKKSALGLNKLSFQIAYPAFVEATGNFKAGALLSYLCNLYDYYHRKKKLRPDGSFWRKREDICKDLNLTTAEYRAAIKLLKETYIKADRRGNNGINHWALDLDKIHAITGGGSKIDQPDELESPNPPIKEIEKPLKAQQAAPCPLLGGNETAEKKKKTLSYPLGNHSDSPKPEKKAILKPTNSSEVLSTFTTSGEDATEEATLDDLLEEYKDQDVSVDRALLFFRRATKLCHNRQPPAQELGKNRGMMGNIMKQGGYKDTYTNLAVIVRDWTAFADMCVKAGYTKKPAWPVISTIADMAGNIPTFVKERASVKSALEDAESKWNLPEI